MQCVQSLVCIWGLYPTSILFNHFLFQPIDHTQKDIEFRNQVSFVRAIVICITLEDLKNLRKEEQKTQ